MAATEDTKVIPEREWTLVTEADVTEFSCQIDGCGQLYLKTTVGTGTPPTTTAGARVLREYQVIDGLTEISRAVAGNRVYAYSPVGKVTLSYTHD